MASGESKGISRFGLRTRVTIVLFLLISSLCLGITLSSYFMLKKQLLGELRARLANMAYTGSFIIDRSSLKSIIKQLAPGLNYAALSPEGEYPVDEAVLEKVEAGDEFQRVCADLNIIREAQPDLLIYAYVIVPTSEKGMLRFVADADAPSLLEEAAESGGQKDEITRWAKLYEAGADSIMAEAAEKKTNMVETTFNWDEEGKSNILSGYAAIMDGDAYLGLLGLDISDKNVSMMLRKTLIIYIVISVAAVVAAVIVTLIMSRMISVPLRRLVMSLHDMAEGEGDLTSKLRVTSSDELGQAAREFNRFTGKLREVISQIKVISADLKSSTGAISDSINDLSANLNLQSGLENDVTAGSTSIKSSVSMLAMNADVQANGFMALSGRLMDLSKSITGLAKESKLASKLTGTITGNVIKGRDSLQAASGIMDSINKSSEEMTGIAGIISDISDQINLLSLNAAIESARAGEAGRGFAVVADEISKLADKTAFNVKDIDRIIRGNSQLIAGGMNSINSMMELFGAVVNDIGQISGLIEKITSYMDEQSRYDEQVHKESDTMKSIVAEIHELVEEHGHSVDSIINSLNSISQLSSGNSEASAAINNSAKEIASFTDDLIKLMTYFRVGSDSWE